MSCDTATSGNCSYGKALPTALSFAELQGYFRTDQDQMVIDMHKPLLNVEFLL